MEGIGRGQPLTGPTSAEDPFGASGDGSPGGHVQLGGIGGGVYFRVYGKRLEQAHSTTDNTPHPLRK